MAEWDAVCVDLESAGTLAKTDRMAIYQYCRLYAETEQLGVDQEHARATVQLLEENLRGEDREDLLGVAQEIGKLRHDIKGYSAQVRQSRALIRQYLVEFGQTPASRSRVKLPAAKPTSKSDQFRASKAGA